MLLRLVFPGKRPGFRNGQSRKAVPKAFGDRMIGRSLVLPLGDGATRVKGIRAAATRVPVAAWWRRRVHFVRNLPASASRRYSSPIFSAWMKASCGISTLPN